MSDEALTIAVERRGSTAIVRYGNAPEGFISNKGAKRLDECITPLLADPAVRAVILTGADDGIFIRHANVPQIVRAAKALQDGVIEPSSFIAAPFPALCERIEQADKPVIAAINGLCMGGGFEIALSCTMRIAGSAVTAIGLPEIRIGIFPGCGGTQRLPLLIGPSRARRFILDGAVVTAAEAGAIGLVDEVAADPLARALELAEGYAARPAETVAAILRLTRCAPGADALAREATAFAELIRDEPQAVERMEAFVAGGTGLNDIA